MKPNTQLRTKAGKVSMRLKISLHDKHNLLMSHLNKLKCIQPGVFYVKKELDQ